WPEIIDGTSVTTVLPDGSGGWFVGGNFTSVGFPGAATSLHTDIVHIRSDHTVDDNWRPDTTDGEVTSMVLLGSVLYIGGTFTGVTSSGSATVIPRNHL